MTRGEFTERGDSMPEGRRARASIRNRGWSSGSPLRRLCLSLGVVAVLAAASGCGEAVPQGQPSRVSVSTGAETVVNTQQTCTPTNAHAKHEQVGIACVTCHPCGAALGFTSVVTFTAGTTTAGGTATAGTATTPASCSVGCHYPMGSPAHSIEWDAAGPLACTSCHDVGALLARAPQHPAVSQEATRATCEACHETAAHTDGTVDLKGHAVGWMDTASPSFHAFSVNQGLAACQGCHRPDLSGGVTGVACATCHEEAGDLPPGVTTWKENCVMCHGGTDNLTGAPPKAIWGQAGDPARGGGVADTVRVGAHTTHVSDSEIAPTFGCAICHEVPTDALTSGHVGGGTATVTFGGLAVNGVTPSPGWDRGSATCSNTYCHGATMGRTTPIVWTQVGQGEGDCGTCHGVPPPPPHAAVDTSGGLARCSGCHPLTIDATGRLIPPREGGAHLNGLLEAQGHEAAWMDTTSPEFHAYSVDRNISSCTGCHGADLSGGTVGVGCGQCHDAALPPGVASWNVNCVMCHGGIDNQTGAPPKATWGNAGDPARGGGIADPLRVGAHTKHVTTALMTPFECGPCHVKPADALSPGHIVSGDSIATVTWAGRAVTGGAQPIWDRSAGTCASTYCHGNYAGTYAYQVWDWGAEELITVYVNYSGKRATPGWTDGPATCGSCHGNPPAATGTWHTQYHGSFASHRDCQLCHPHATGNNLTGGTAITNPALHINGVVDVTPAWTGACYGCH